MPAYTRVCPYCGETFTTKQHNRLLCSEECRYAKALADAKEKYAAKKKAKCKKAKVSIDAIMEVARVHGLTYGKAVEAIKNGKLSIK